jgi:hypothetical protein
MALSQSRLNSIGSPLRGRVGPLGPCVCSQLQLLPKLTLDIDALNLVYDVQALSDSQLLW